MNHWKPLNGRDKKPSFLPMIGWCLFAFGLISFGWILGRSAGRDQGYAQAKTQFEALITAEIESRLKESKP